MSISISEIPDSVLVPGQYQEIDNSLAGSSDDVKKVLVVDIMSSAGSAIAGKPVAIASKAKARALLGEGAPAAIAVQNFLDLDTTEELYALPLAEAAAGVAAVKKITVAAVTPAAGTLTRYIGGVKVAIAVTANDAAASIASNLVAAINGTLDMPVEASVDGATPSLVLLTSKVKGEFGNDIDVVAGLYGETDPAGVTLTVAVGTAGSGNPAIAAALSAMGGVRYHYLITTLADEASLAAFASELKDRYSAMRQIGGRLFVLFSGVSGDATTAGSVIARAAKVNSPHIVIVPRGSNPQDPASWIARFAAPAIRKLADDPAANTQGTECSDLVATVEFDSDTRQKLLEAGVATWRADSTGSVVIERLVTSYTEDSAGNPDTSYLDVQVVETVDAIRTAINAAAAKRFKTWKLASTEENFGSGSRVMSPGVWKTFLVDMYQQVFIQEKQWCQDLESYKKSLVVEIATGSKTRLNYQHRPVLIGQFLVAAGLNQFE